MDADPHALAASVAAEAGRLALAATLLATRFLRLDPADPLWPDRDRLLVTPPGLAASLEARLSGAPGLVDCLAAAPAQALATGLGLAIAERLLAARFGRSLVDHRTWILLGAADLASGAAQEAAAAAGALELGRLAVLAVVHPDETGPLARFAALGWTLRRPRADDPGEVEAALSAALRSRRPTLIALLADPDTVAPAHPPIPWPDLWQRGTSARRAWLRRLHRHALRDAFERAIASPASPLPADLVPDPAASTETAARDLLGRVAPLLPELAYLPPIQVQALAGAMNGIALHRGLIPVGAAPLADSEPIGPALRTAAARSLRVLHLLAEPANPCPIGGLRAAWRAMANLHVNRPGGAGELRACLEIAIRRTEGPSLLLLSAATDPMPSPDPELRAGCARGGYLAAGPERGRDLTLIASGAELGPARLAQLRLAASGLAVALISLPCWDRFAAQDPAWREALLGAAPRLGIEAGSGFGWERWLGERGRFLGPDGPGSLTADAIERAARDIANPSVPAEKSALRPLARAVRFR